MQTFQLIETGGYVWLKPSNAYYASLHISKAALALLGDKYIKVPSNNSNFTDLEYSVPLQVTAPSDAESIDGSQLGL